MIRLFLCCILLLALPVAACYAGRPCYSPEQASAHAGKDICLLAHVYSIEKDPDGTRYLDVCGPGIHDKACRFAVISLAQDSADVGSLDGFATKDVKLRGVVHTVQGESFLLLSEKRQFHGGPEKFRPNPELLRGFSSSSGSTAFRDPALRAHGRHGSSVFSASSTARQ